MKKIMKKIKILKTSMNGLRKQKQKQKQKYYSIINNIKATYIL